MSTTESLNAIPSVDRTVSAEQQPVPDFEDFKNTDAVIEYLVQWHLKTFKGPHYTTYIRERLAKDFAWELARVIAAPQASDSSQLSTSFAEYVKSNAFRQIPLTDQAGAEIGFQHGCAAAINSQPSDAEIRRKALEEAVPQPELTVWYGPMPESNGKSNFTAILVRKGGDFTDGITIDRSEYPDRVRYEADRVRYLIGELDKRPFILDYDADKHSGYAEAPAGMKMSKELAKFIVEDANATLQDQAATIRELKAKLDAAQTTPVNVPSGWRESLTLTVERLNDDAEMYDRQGNNSTAADRRARAYEISQMLSAAPSTPIANSENAGMIGQSKAVLRLVDEYIDGVQTQQTRTKLRAGLMDLFAAAPAAPVESKDKQDAERWRALLNSARIRPLGSAGIQRPENDNYAHLGLELWTIFGRDYSPELLDKLDQENALGREWLEKYADIAAIAAQKGGETA